MLKFGLVVGVVLGSGMNGLRAATTGAATRNETALVLSSASGCVSSSSGSFNSFVPFQNNGSSRMLKQARSLNIMYTFTDATKVNAYGICTGGSYFNSSRGPKAWKIYGSNDYVPTKSGSTSESSADAGATWEELDSRTDETEWGEDEYRYYSFSNTKKYTTYKIDITANNSDQYTQWKYMEYCSEASCQLTVAGAPIAINEVTPNFGTVEMPTEETTFTSSALAESSAGDARATCKGWKVYTLGADGSTWVEDVARAGEGRSFTWTTMPTVDTKVEWQYDAEYLVSCETANGTVAGTGWVADGASVTLTPTAAEGFAFDRWMGDVPEAQSTQNPLVLSVTKPLVVKAVFLPSNMTEYAQYVSPDGSDENDGFSAESPKKTVKAAVEALPLTSEGIAGKVYIAAGTYKFAAPLEISGPISLIGAGNDEATGATVLKGQGYYTYGCDFRVLKLTSAQASVQNLIVSDGVVGLGEGVNAGGAIYMTAGVVTNCVIRNSLARQASNPIPTGGGIYIDGTDALVTHCVISNCSNYANASWIGDKCGAGVQIVSGKISNSLIADCHTSVDSSAATVTGGIYASGGTVENCTVVGCKGSAHGGVYAQTTAAKIVNTVAIGNVKRILIDGAATETVNGFTGKLDSFDTCVSDDEMAANDTCTTATTGAFTDYEHGDFVPSISGALHNKGKTLDSVPALDLAGCNRTVGAIDIGCYEQNASATCVIVGEPSAYGTVNVGWGSHSDLSGVTTISVQERWDDPSGEMYAVTTGWALYLRSGDDWVLSTSGTGASAEVEIPSVASRFVWKFARYYAMTLGTVGSGTATGAEWVKEGDTFEPVVSAAEGWHFAGWDGNIEASDATSTSFLVSKALSLKALFLPVGFTHPIMYVSTEGNDENDGFTRATAKASVKNAVQTVSLYASLGGEIFVAAGRYSEMAADKNLQVNYPIRVIGESGNPDDVLLHYVGYPGNFFILNDAGASINSVTISNVTASGTVSGMGVRLSENGGTVSNCVITSCGGSGYGMKGGGVYSGSANGLVTHTKVLNCYVGDENVWGGNKAGGIQLDAGRAENCLIDGCYTQTKEPADVSKPRSVGGLYVAANAKATNCTVINSRGTCAGGIWAASGASVVNCAVIGCDYAGEKSLGSGEKAWAGAAAAFANCATDGETPINTTCLAGLTTEAFRDFAAGDYVPATGGMLVNAGATPTGWNGYTDLAGNARVKGKAIDIGCYEGNPSGLMIRIR